MSDDNSLIYDDCTKVTSFCTVEHTIYGYAPNLGVNAFFCAFFGVFTIINVLLTWRYKTWFYGSLIVLGALGEGIGYVGRIMLHNNPWDTIGFQIQICTLIFSPSFLAAALYLTLKYIARAIGPQFSIIKPVLYPYIFIACDIFSLLLQAIGGGVASGADDQDGTKLGGNIMLAGIVFQVVTFLLLYILIAIYIIKLRKNASTLSSDAVSLLSSRDFKIFAWAMFVASLFIFIRCVYRIAELAEGWANEIMRDEVGYIILDGVMCLIATAAMTVGHPGHWFKYMTKADSSTAEREKPLRNESSDASVMA
ncbi:RTA1 like protein-domain-containing protein [Bisporella sp. PMI_857]|nr:RTA1 like protein-domain-containing protein [Bisporella sp. PMI_857]